MATLTASSRSLLGLSATSFALNFVWEMLQSPLFADMAGLPFWEASRRCLWATLGDVAITLAAYAAIAAWVRNVSWICSANTRFVVAFGIVAFGLSALIERHAIGAGRWIYGPGMSLVPWLQIGLAPAAQWILLPVLSLLVGRRIARAMQRKL